MLAVCVAAHEKNCFCVNIATDDDERGDALLACLLRQRYNILIIIYYEEGGPTIAFKFVRV